MQERKIITVVLVVAVIVIAIVGYEFFVANSLSGYTKVSITTPNQPYSIKFGAVQYNITFQYGLPTPSGGAVFGFQVSTDNSSKGFGATQAAKYSFSGLQIVVGSVNSNHLILYVKSSVYKLRANNFFPCNIVKDKKAQEQKLKTHK